MVTKIQINSLDALERLIGDDTELEIEVRHSVIEAFAKTWIKKIGNNEQIAKQVEALKQDAYNRANEYAKNELGISTKHGKLSQQAQYNIKQFVNDQIKNIIDETVKSRVRFVSDEVDKSMSAHIENVVKSHLKEFDKQRILEIAERVMKEM